MATLFIHVALCLSLIVQVKSQTCLRTKTGNGLPIFQDYRGGGIEGNRITLHHQAIIPSYKFDCDQMCGNITEWGVDVHGGGSGDNMRYTLDLQVWRPSPTVDNSTGTGCYSLVGNNRFTSIPLSDQVAQITPSPQDYIQFRPGDVLGFYVEEADKADDGVVILTSYSDTSSFSESVWYASITPTVATTQTIYSVGSNGILSIFTQAAPVISIATVNYSCPPLPSMTVALPTPSPMTEGGPSTISDKTTTDNFVPNITPLIIGVIVATVIAVIALSLLTIVTIVVVVKRCRKESKDFHVAHKSRALNNQMYGKNKNASRLTIQSYDYVDLRNSSQTPAQPRLMVRYKRSPEEVYIHSTDPSVSANHDRGHARKPPLLPPRKQEVVAASIHNERISDKDYDYAATGMTDSYVDVDEYEDTSMLNGSPSRPKVNVYDDVFDTAGIYVPTPEQRASLKGHYVIQETRDYNKLKFFEEEKIYWAPASTKPGLYMQLASKKYREIPRNQLKISTKVGSSQFGEVRKAIWSISGTTKELAIKTLKPGANEDEKLKVLQEAAIMGQFFHPNIVRLYGVVTVGEPVIICLELMTNGDLRNYLACVSPEKQSSRPLEVQLLRFSKQIAEGMNYLASKSFVHRDLAARNILLDESLTCKIGDFGMARDLMDETYYMAQSKGAKIPVKWTAPEALLYKKYSTDSDVWSYGMVLFEIWSVGKKPFSQHTNSQVLRLVQTGHCQSPPPGCPRAIYELMIDCWNPDHSERPTFSKISHYLMSSSNSKLLQRAVEGVDESSRAMELGTSLSEGKELYKDLQNTYQHKNQ